MKKWLIKHGLEWQWVDIIKFPFSKPPATVGIDDRVITFMGTFPSNLNIMNFKPWNKKEQESK
jgi:hypothetical protein